MHWIQNEKKEHFHQRAAWLGLITSSRSRELKEAARFPSTSEAAICVEPQGFNASWKPRAQKSEDQSRVWTVQHVLKCILHSMTTHSHITGTGQFTNLSGKVLASKPSHHGLRISGLGVPH